MCIQLIDLNIVFFYVLFKLVRYVGQNCPTEEKKRSFLAFKIYHTK
jgi:hypothetical protein